MSTRSKLGSLFKYVIRFIFQGPNDPQVELVRLSSSETIDTIDLIRVLKTSGRGFRGGRRL